MCDGVGKTIRGDHRVLAAYRGFFGMVYICRQDLPGGKHLYKAIKTFREGKDLVARGLFDRELVNWVALPPHPNVVQAKEADTVDKLLILEFIHSPNLRDVATRGSVHPRHFLQWAREIAAGIRFLHVENGFVHRDLRPANVLVGTDHHLQAKVSDLGIGKPLDLDASNHTVIGTFTYMAPEVHEGCTDYRSDIFSYGATLFYLLTGRHAVKLTTKNLRKVKSPATLVGGVPDDVTNVILRCLERQPDDRFQSMDDLIAALDGIDPWPVEHLRYENCPKHGYLVNTRDTRDTRDTRCPFCLYLEDFRRRQEYLERLLHEEAKRRTPS